VRDRVAGRTKPSYRWALSDINLHAAPGESWGLVGANGAGKSTLLKILSRVMYPTAGSISVSGRVGALIEVRAGISPLLTGRENIFLTGSIMGLKRRDVAKRFDEIVEFAELNEAIDRQVKYYSSGMSMRLGFGVAAFLQPDVLLVDEVLAVGDATFQQRCLNRIRAVLAEGSTLFFVSHDLAAVEATCTNGIWVHNGQVQVKGPIRDVLAAYRSAVEGQASESWQRVDGRVRVREATATFPDGGPAQTGGPLDLDLTIEASEEHRSWIYLGVSQGAATPIFLINPGRETTLKPGTTQVHCTIPSIPLPAGQYYVWGGIYENWTNGTELLGWQPLARFDVIGPGLDAAPRAIVRLAPVHVDSGWDIAEAAA
ncbi:MAG: lipopolysaccharide transport system ATP-binding protein, partial [Solirubrobacteraceae bacterium]|nr:lipopolysaccharide transport system ATP-binding protein [Solirubrobacteraceae bacterium]